MKRQQKVAGDEDMDLERSQAVGGAVGLSVDPDVAPKRKDNRLFVGMEHPQRVGVAGAPQGPPRALGDPQRFDDIVSGRLTGAEIEPDEAALRTQRGDTLLLGGVEPRREPP